MGAFPFLGGGVAYRIFKGNTVGFVVNTPALSGLQLEGVVQCVYDSGINDEFRISAFNLTTNAQSLGPSDHPALDNGWITGVYAWVAAGGPPNFGSIYCSAFIVRQSDLLSQNVTEIIAQGYVGATNSLMLGRMVDRDFASTWVFQGTVAEDATGGTHVCTLTISPGAANELQILYGQITDGATATAQTVVGFIDDGTNVLGQFVNTEGNSTTVSGLTYGFPTSVAVSGANLATSAVGLMPSAGWIVSGTMRIVLQVTTAAVSVTHTFSIVCRLKGLKPTATLADSVGTPVTTVNTNRIF